jgi:hypothetical protein
MVVLDKKNTQKRLEIIKYQGVKYIKNQVKNFMSADKELY